MSKGPTRGPEPAQTAWCRAQEWVVQGSHLGSLGLKFLIWKAGVNQRNNYNNIWQRQQIVYAFK